MSVITGTSGNNNLNGGSGDDIMDGGAGNDHLSGGSGNDVMLGGSGDDRLNGGSGTDTLNGGSGNDILNGDSGNDMLVYTLGENSGATDIYTGGSGIDTVRLQLTSAEWGRADVQSQIAQYIQHLNIVKANKNTGEVSNGSANDFTFVFNGGTRLTVQMMEELDVWVDGQPFDFHAPFITVADGAGAVTEDATNPTLSDSGTINFVDVDWSQSHSASIMPSAGNTLGGTLTASVSNSATGDGAGVVTWDYSVANGATQYLGVGDSVTETFTVTITDSSGKTDTQMITVTVTGTNDQPTLTIADAVGAMSEGNGAATLTDSGALSFADLDSNDVVTVSQTSNNDIVWSGGTLGAGVAAALVAGFSVDQDSWDYSASQNLDFLGAGETITFSYDVVATDDSGAGNATSTATTVTITITGTNDQPTLTIADAVGAMSEGNGAATLTDSGALSFADLDSNDVVTVSQTSNNDIVWSGGTLGAGVAAALVAGFSVDQDSWDYSASQNLDFLGAGETITFSYDVVATDDSGAGNATSTATTVTITITGTNDQPTLTIADAVGAMSEGNGAATLTDSGALSFADLDSNDVVTVSQTSNNDIVWSGGTLGAGVAAALVAGFSVDQDSWDYSASQNLDFLGAGETITFSYDVVATDDSGAGNATSTATTVTITITGTNDQPTLTIADAVGAMSEGNGAATLTDSGALSLRRPRQQRRGDGQPDLEQRHRLERRHAGRGRGRGAGGRVLGRPGQLGLQREPEPGLPGRR